MFLNNLIKVAAVGFIGGSGLAIAPAVSDVVQSYQHDYCNCKPTTPKKTPVKAESPHRTINKFFELINAQDNRSISQAYTLLAPDWPVSQGLFMDYWKTFDKGSIKIYSLVVIKPTPTTATAKLIWFGKKSGWRAGGEFTWRLELIKGKWKIVEVVG